MGTLLDVNSRAGISVYDFFMHRMKSGTGGWEDALLLVSSTVVGSEVGSELGVKINVSRS
jgi:hypothetical protein